MIQGRSNFVYRVEDEGEDKGKFVSFGLKDKYTTTPIHVDVNIVSADVLDIEAFRAWRPDYENAEFILENGQYKCGWAIEKMSKSMFNVVNPDMIVEKYGADTLRLYEMFLGPVEQSKPWDTNGIDGCHRFLKKFWNLVSSVCCDGIATNEEATADNLKSVHKRGSYRRQPQERTQTHQEGQPGHRAVLVQHLHLCLHDLRQRTVAAEV